MTHGTACTFANHRGVVPLLWVFFVLAGCELVIVHLLIALWSATAAWFASIATAASMAWLAVWIISWRRHPHELDDQRLRLHMGSLRHLDVPLADIREVSGELATGILGAPDTRNLVPLAHPNRLIVLRSPWDDRRKTRRIAIRVDDPAAFDTAISERCRT